MYLQLPSIPMDRKNSRIISPVYFPYPLEIYGVEDAKNRKTLKVVSEEVEQLLRRYAVVYPSVLERFEETRYFGFRCLVNDESTGITRGILERLGYILEESAFTPYQLYWIVLKSREEKRKVK